MHPLLQLLAVQPHLLAEHAEAYAALVAVEVPRISAAWKRTALLAALAMCGLTVAMLLAGVAGMLWAVLPWAPMRAPWALIAVPALPLVAALACGIAARARGGSEAFSQLQQQVRADVALLREAVQP